jgi:hypothetical protein
MSPEIRIDSTEALYKRFRAIAERMQALGLPFQNPGAAITPEEFESWLTEADQVHNDMVQLLTDAVRVVDTI